jgi:hypothetical protein
MAVGGGSIYALERKSRPTAELEWCRGLIQNGGTESAEWAPDPEDDAEESAAIPV